MSNHQNTSGYATTYAVITLCILSILGATAAGPEYIMGRHIQQQGNILSEETKIYDAVSEVIKAMQADTTPESDSLSDPVWAVVDNGFQGISFTLEDMSTGINLNTVPAAILKESSLARAADGNSLAEEVSVWREEGPIRNSEQVFDQIPEDLFQTYYSLYGFLNPRVCDPTVLESALSSRLGETLGASVASASMALTQGYDVKEEDLQAYLESNAPSAALIMTLKPMINVNFADQALLEAILEFRNSGQKLDDPKKVLATMMFDRQAGEVLPLDLDRYLESEQDAPWIRDFLGTQTWFWKLTASNESGLCLESIIARLPNESNSYQVIERRWIADA